MLLWLLYLFSFYRTRKERVHSEYKKWILLMSTGAYNTTHLRSLLAPLIFLNIFFKYFYYPIFNIFIVVFLFFPFFPPFGYLMQIFFISLHFLYDKGLLLPRNMQSAFKRLSVPFALDAGLFYKN